MNQISLYTQEVVIQKMLALLVAGLIAFGALTLATSVRAEETDGTSGEAPATTEASKSPLYEQVNRPRAELRKDVQGIRKDAMEERQGIRKEGRDDIKAMASTTRGEMMEKRGERKDTVTQARKDGTIGTAEFLKAMAENRGDIKQIRDDRREAAKTEWHDIRSRLASTTDEAEKRIFAKQLETKKRIVEAHGKKAQEQLNAAVDRLKKIADRISSRLDKAQEKGKDVTSLRVKLDAAKVKITEAKTVIDALSGIVSEVADMDNPAEGKQKLEDAFKAAREKIKMAHKALVDVTTSLKGLGSIANSNPTGAPASTSTTQVPASTDTTEGSTNN
ncbi:MAG: hypothetical protein AAB545_01815 [Patescibacteria group bacterium]|mgnify:CR=1 FL=1